MATIPATSRATRGRTRALMGALALFWPALAGAFAGPLAAQTNPYLPTRGPDQPGFLASEAESVDLGRIEGSGSTVSSLLLRNSGGLPLAVGEIQLHWPDESAWIEKNGCNSPLPPGASCAVTLGWRPKRSGAHAGSLIVTHDGSNATTRVRLLGQALRVEKTSDVSNLIHEIEEKIGKSSESGRQPEPVKLNARLIALSSASAILQINGISYIFGHGDRIAIADTLYEARLSPPNLILMGPSGGLTIPFGNRLIHAPDPARPDSVISPPPDPATGRDPGRNPGEAGPAERAASLASQGSPEGGHR